MTHNIFVTMRKIITSNTELIITYEIRLYLALQETEHVHFNRPLGLRFTPHKRIVVEQCQ